MLIKAFIYTGIVLVGIVIGNPSCRAASLMVDKNLFSQDRKPTPPESAGAPTPGKPGMPVTNIQLDGVMIQGNTRKALVRLKAQPGGGGGAKKPQSPFVTVRESQQVGDYRVVKIESKSISLEKDGQKFVVSLFSDGKVITPPAAPPPPAQASQPGAQPGGAPQHNQAGIPQGRVQRGQNPQMQPPMPVPGQAPFDPSMGQQGGPVGEVDPNMANIEVGTPDDEQEEEQ